MSSQASKKDATRQVTSLCTECTVTSSHDVIHEKLRKQICGTTAWSKWRSQKASTSSDMRTCTYRAIMGNPTITLPTYLVSRQEANTAASRMSLPSTWSPRSKVKRHPSSVVRTLVLKPSSFTPKSSGFRG